MLQLLYVSSASIAGIDLEQLIVQAQRNNARTHVTGLLYTDGKRFLQVLEGSHDDVESVFDRLRADSRHRGIVMLSRRIIDAREFGSWSMARARPGEQFDVFAERIRDLCRRADPSVTGTFLGLVETRMQSVPLKNVVSR